MTERIDDLTPDLRDLLRANAPIPPMPSDVRDRLRTRLNDSRADSTAWRGPAEVDDPLRPRRPWRRRVAAAVVLAAAAAMILAYTLGGRPARTLADHTEPMMDRHTISHTPRKTVPEPTPRPAGIRSAARAKALRFQLVDHSSSRRKMHLHSFVERDKTAKRYGIRLGESYWSAGPNNVHELYLQASDGKGPCSWRSINARTTRNRCKLSGRQRLAGYLRQLYKRKPKLAPDKQHQILFENISDSRGNFWRTHYAFRAVYVDGSDVASASVVVNPTTKFPEVRVVFTPVGRTKFAQLTKHNVGSRLAIVVHGNVETSPVIQDGITGGRTTITMGGSRAEAKATATKLVNSLRSATP